MNIAQRAVGAASAAAVPVLAVLAAVGVVRWDVCAISAAVLCCVPFFLSFERRAPNARELVTVAVMTAFSVAGRFVFAPLPFFKPVTAITALSGMYLGASAGFMTGALSAVISNIYFGQGAWTPFQMLCWGVTGFAAGLLNRRGLLEKPVPLAVYGIFAGGLYSVIMDVWTTLSADGFFSAGRWLAAVTAALPITAVYCVSNVVFLTALRKPVGKRLERIKTKYGIFENR